MKYTIEGYSQKTLLELGVDAIDALILRWFADFKDTGKMVSRIRPEDGHEYFWVKYQAIIDDMPILGISGPDAMARRMKKLEAAGLLNHWHCLDKGSFSMYRLNQPVYSTLIFDTPPIQKSDPSDSKVGPPSDAKNGPPSDSKVGAKYPSTSHNPSTSLYQSTSNPTAPVLDFPSEAFRALWEKWTAYKKSQFKFKYKDVLTEQTAVDGLISKSGGKIEIASAIVNHSMEHGWKGLFELKDKAKQVNPYTYKDPNYGKSLEEMRAELQAQRDRRNKTITLEAGK